MKLINIVFFALGIFSATLAFETEGIKKRNKKTHKKGRNEDEDIDDVQDEFEMRLDGDEMFKMSREAEEKRKGKKTHKKGRSEDEDSIDDVQDEFEMRLDGDDPIFKI